MKNCGNEGGETRCCFSNASTRLATVSTLSRSLGIHSTTASRLCDRLVAKGLIDRNRAVGDRRETELTLTGEGRRLVSRVTRRRRHDLSAIAVKLGPHTAATARDALRAFAAAASELGFESDQFAWPGSAAC